MRIGFIDYFLDEWHANNYPQWIKEAQPWIFSSSVWDRNEVAVKPPHFSFCTHNKRFSKLTCPPQLFYTFHTLKTTFRANAVFVTGLFIQ